MKPTSSIILIALCAVGFSHFELSNAQTTTKPNSHQYSGEAKHRKSSCPDLVAPKKPASKKYNGDCELTDALYNISATLTSSQQVTFNQFIQYEIIDNILLNVQLTEVEMIVECSYAVKHFLEVNVDIDIEFQEIGVWGYIRDFKQVAVDLQADVAQTTVTLDSNDDCELFDALLNATSGNASMQSAVIELIAELRIVLKDKTLTHGQIMAKLHEHFKIFFDLYPGWKSFFLSIQINGFGSLESLDDVCHQYDRSLTISKVISGSSDSDCILLGMLTNATADTKYTISVRGQLKQFHDVIAAYFASTTDITLRLHYVVQQYYQMEIVEGFIISIIDILELEDGEGGIWGDFYDLLSCSEFCYNQGDCGNLDDGLGTTPAPSTTVAPTTAASTVAPASCGSRSNLIVVTAQNTTILTDVLTTNYNSWNSSVRFSFNTYFNLIRTAIWNNVQFPTPASKITEIVADFNSYAKNQPKLKSIVFSIFFSSWQGDVTQFCNCGSG